MDGFEILSFAKLIAFALIIVSIVNFVSGYKFSRKAIALYGFFSGVYVATYLILDKSGNDYAALALFAGVFIGVTIALAAFLFYKISLYFVISGFLLYILETLNLFNTKSPVLNLICSLIVAIPLALFLQKYREKMRIFSSATISSLILILSINVLSLKLSNTQDEPFTNYLDVNESAEFYIPLWVILIAISSILQYSIYKWKLKEKLLNRHSNLNNSLNSNNNDSIKQNTASLNDTNNIKTNLSTYLKNLGNWKLEERLGKGSYGSVYKISKDELNSKYYSALKVLTIPDDQTYNEAKSLYGTNIKEIEKYCLNIVNEITNEINLLYSLKGNSNIVSYEDHSIFKKENEFKWDILIRMEYLDCLEKYLSENPIKYIEGIQIGIDICKALEVCESYNIIHRDIKVGNIFRTKTGKYKLGDFGISKKLEETFSAATQRGTFMYIAPEVFNGSKYDNTIDFYSLGIVLYKIFNHNRVPFLPNFPESINHGDLKESLSKRLSGEKIKKPLFSNNELLDKIILKACSYNPKDRYQNASEFRQEIESFKNTLDHKDKNKIIIDMTKKHNFSGTKTINIKKINNAITSTLILNNNSRCPHCSSLNIEEAKFCFNCGKRIIYFDL